MEPEAIKIVLFVFIGWVIIVAQVCTFTGGILLPWAVGDELIVIGWGFVVRRLLSFMVEFDKTDCFRACDPFFRPDCPAAHGFVKLML
jgi:hypothetical protein